MDHVVSPGGAPVRIHHLVGGVVVASAALVLTTDDGPVLCPFRRCTGGYCPGCGGTRAVGHIVRGDLAAAWSAHPWVVLVALQGLVLGALLAVRHRHPRRDSAAGWRLPILVANVALGLVIWVARLSDGSIPAPSRLTLPL